jgi:cytochrome c peroxidase
MAREGLGIFQGKGNCIACHVGPNFTDERFHNTGVAWREGKLTDPGRFAITGKNDDRGAFKPPTLREVARTAPYMHDGSLATRFILCISHPLKGRTSSRFCVA